jgi:RNA polymerase sigma factor (sigma-70 family)
MTDDSALLRHFADTGAEEAFAALVRRNLDLVYATALRIVGDTSAAQDVAQAVFVALARKATALRDHPAPVSWLYTGARYAALKALRSEQRRQAREQEAFTMQQLDSSEPPPEWERLRPLLDDVLHELGETDREAVLLRFFRGAPFAELAAALRVNEGAARMRVDRALQRMNQLLAQRGIHSTASALGIALAAQPAIAAPTALATSITGTALAGAAAGGGVVATLFAMSKFKLILASVLVCGGLATALVEGRTHVALRAQLQALAREDSASLETRKRALRAAAAQLGEQNPDVAELNRLQARLDTLRARPLGVTDAAFHAPRLLGRATPEAAIETFAWAMDHGDLDLAASFIAFGDDSPANREAFLANFSEAVRARYRTAERIYAAALYGAVHGKAAIPDPMTRLQIAGIQERAFDEVRLDLWFQTASGREVRGGATYQRRADGWGEKPVAMLAPAVLGAIRQRLDPATGDYIPPAPPRR